MIKTDKQSRFILKLWIAGMSLLLIMIGIAWVKDFQKNLKQQMFNPPVQIIKTP